MSKRKINFTPSKCVGCRHYECINHKDCPYYRNCFGVKYRLNDCTNVDTSDVKFTQVRGGNK